MKASASAACKKVDRRVARTQRAIMSALDKLLMEEDASKITVSAIAREADIDRKTFYLHYSGIEDLMNARIEQSLEQLLSVVRDTKKYPTFSQRVHALLANIDTTILRDLPLYRRISRYTTVDRALELFDRALNSLLEKTKSDTVFTSSDSFRRSLRFYSAGAIALYGQWLRDGTAPIETVSKTVEDAVIAGMVPSTPQAKIA